MVGVAGRSGAKTIRTPKLDAEIIEHLESGVGYKRAALLAGVGVTTLREWRKDDPHFAATLERADSTVAQKCWKSILLAAEMGDWKAAAYIIDKRFTDPPDVDEDEVADLAVRLNQYEQAMRATIPTGATESEFPA